ncbi:unnamed protein product, partial [marine sediment metagenome]
MTKIILITNIPTPYRIPLFNELKRQLSSKNIKFKVIFGASGYPRRKWKIDMSECCFDYNILSSRKIILNNSEKTIFTYRGLFKVIKSERPEVIITIGFSLATTKIWLLSWLKKIKYIIWSGAAQRDKCKKDSLIRRIQRKYLIKRAHGFIAYGSKAKSYLISLGANRTKIKIGINTVDTGFFQRETKKCRNSSTRSNINWLLYIGNLTAGKRVDLLLDMVKSLLKNRDDFILKLVGDGP